MENQMDSQLPEREEYVPRPRWQVWAARIGVVLFLLLVVLQYFQIALGGV